ncbi:hypothetical protein [Clostridium thermobutyricum]|uniref:hypothetical protein n=1 Tax=Clostridium thermobutyricum TaxID=29372 RepID=UPI003F522253
MNLKDIFIKYDYLKYRNGLNEMQEELKELENSKYSIKTYDFRSRVQENRITNDRIENINIKIEKLKDRINKNKEFVNDIDYFFGLVLKKEFNTLYDLYINFKNERKFKDNKNVSGSTLYRYKKVVGEEIQMIIENNSDIF